MPHNFFRGNDQNIIMDTSLGMQVTKQYEYPIVEAEPVVTNL